MESFDYVIVGAGSAGCVIANRLALDGNAKVCVLEAGPRDWNPFIHWSTTPSVVHPSRRWSGSNHPVGQRVAQSLRRASDVGSKANKINAVALKAPDATNADW